MVRANGLDKLNLHNMIMESLHSYKIQPKDQGLNRLDTYFLSANVIEEEEGPQEGSNS